MTKIDNITEREAFILNACPDVSTSFFKRPLDCRIFAIKEVSGNENDIGQHNYAIILADEMGKRIGKYVLVDSAPDGLETFIHSCLLPDLDRYESCF